MDLRLYVNAQMSQGIDAETIADEPIRLTRTAQDTGFDSIVFGQHS